MTETVIVADRVSKRYRLYRRRHQSVKEILVRRSLGEWEELWALNDVSFEVPRGQLLGVIGHNGSGKSTLLKVLSRILLPDRGRVSVNGRVSSLLELGAGFQPEYTGRENVYLYGCLLGLRRRDIDRHYQSITEFSELGSFIDYPVKNYSSGMYMRLGFAVAVHLDPDILLIDEVLAVGDASFQQKCFEHLHQLRARGCTIILVSHDLESVGRFCERAIWLDHGRLAVDGSTDRTIQAYLEATASSRAALRSREEEAVPPDILITSVHYLDCNGREVHEMESGDRLTVDIGYEARTEIGALELGVTIFRDDGVRCVDAHLHTATEGIRIPAGPGRLVLDFPSFSLQAGRYASTVAMYDPMRTRFHQFHDRMYPFSVRDSRSTGGVVWIDFKWSVRPGEVAVRHPREAAPNR